MSFQKYLEQRRLGAAARVALLMQNSPHYVGAYLGSMAAGCVAVPLNAHERAGVLARQIEHVGCSLLVVDPNHPEWQALEPAVAALRVDVLAMPLGDEADSCEAFCRRLGDEKAGTIRSSSTESVATIIYTSGTTARPKGVMLSHGNLAANVRAIVEYLAIDGRDKVLCVLPFHFSYGNSVLLSNLTAGAHLVLEDNLAFPHLTLRRLQDERITGFPGVPSTFALLLSRCRLEEFDLKSLRYVTQAGGAMPRAHTEQLRAALPNARIFIMYGQTEATSRLTYLPPELLGTKPGSVGLPLPGIELEIRADDEPVRRGETGEICVRGPSVMLGYWRDAELSAQVLRGGWLHTGDLGHLDEDSYLYIDGRAADMIKVGAFRVSPQEVEEVIAAYPGVEEVAVTGVPDEMLGQALKATVVLRHGVARDARGVKAHCRSRLANYKIPKVVEFAAVLPRTSSGKVQRYKLV